MIDQIILRVVTMFVVGLIPIGICLPLIESIKNEKLEMGVFIAIMLWLVYLNVWVKRVYAIKYSETISILGAWSKARVCLNTDIITKLAFIPGIGVVFDNWINRNNSSHQDDREIRVNTEKEN